MFLGRKKELNELERIYKQDGFQIFVITGAEGVGKTTLVEEFCKGKNTIFFTASKESGRANIFRFSQIVLDHYKDENTKPFTFWQDALKYIATNEYNEDTKKSGRIVLVLDELSEFAQRDFMFIKMFQNTIDHDLKDSNIFMVIIDSDIKLTKKTFLNSITSLRSEITGKLHLERFVIDEADLEKLKDEAEKTEKGIHNVRMKMQKVSAETIILREGEVNEEMYKIISGRAICYFKYGTDDEYVLASLKEGSCFGEYSLLTGKPGIYTVVAFTDMLVMKITKEDFGTFVEMNAQNSVSIMQNMAKMLNVMAVNIDMIRNE